MCNQGNCRPNSDAAAHHLVRKGGPQELDPNAPTNNIKQLHALLRRIGMDIDEAANGVWLPKDANAAAARGTRALPHANLHTGDYDVILLRRLSNAENLGGGPAVRAELRAIAKELLSGKLNTGL
jgi:hypothetical protein